jgi:hypothetical protein
MGVSGLAADEAEIEASFREAIRIAKERKSVTLEKRAEATYAEYRSKKASGSGERGFRLPLCCFLAGTCLSVSKQGGTTVLNQRNA